MIVRVGMPEGIADNVRRRRRGAALFGAPWHIVVNAVTKDLPEPLGAVAVSFVTGAATGF